MGTEVSLLRVPCNKRPPPGRVRERERYCQSGVAAYEGFWATNGQDQSAPSDRSEQIAFGFLRSLVGKHRSLLPSFERCNHSVVICLRGNIQTFQKYIETGVATPLPYPRCSQPQSIIRLGLKHISGGPFLNVTLKGAISARAQRSEDVGPFRRVAPALHSRSNHSEANTIPPPRKAQTDMTVPLKSTVLRSRAGRGMFRDLSGATEMRVQKVQNRYLGHVGQEQMNLPTESTR